MCRDASDALAGVLFVCRRASGFCAAKRVDLCVWRMDETPAVVKTCGRTSEWTCAGGVKKRDVLEVWKWRDDVIITSGSRWTCCFAHALSFLQTCLRSVSIFPPPSVVTLLFLCFYPGLMSVCPVWIRSIFIHTEQTRKDCEEDTPIRACKHTPSSRPLGSAWTPSFSFSETQRESQPWGDSCPSRRRRHQNRKDDWRQFLLLSTSSL